MLHYSIYIILHNFVCHHRLHREALKQAATDPKTGIIDVSILTTGISASERQRRQALAREIHKLVQTKCRSGGMVSQSAVFDMLKEQSQTVSSILACSLLATHFLL